LNKTIKNVILYGQCGYVIVFHYAIIEKLDQSMPKANGPAKLIILSTSARIWIRLGWEECLLFAVFGMDKVKVET
jgi:hypothetical protein